MLVGHICLCQKNNCHAHYSLSLRLLQPCLAFFSVEENLISQEHHQVEILSSGIGFLNHQHLCPSHTSPYYSSSWHH